MEAAETAFGEEVSDEQLEREQKLRPSSRALVAYDDGRPVGLAAAHAFDLSIPGGELPCAGVTWVGPGAPVVDVAGDLCPEVF